MVDLTVGRSPWTWIYHQRCTSGWTYLKLDLCQLPSDILYDIGVSTPPPPSDVLHNHLKDQTLGVE